MRRSFLFLQGPHGPFFQRLGEKLRSDGAEVVRVNFSGGDWLDWHGNDTVAYRGTLGDWPAWVKKLAAERRVTDLVLYGDCRPLHRAAIDALKPQDVSVHVFEEGYFRPNWITCEKGGVNGHTSIPKDPQEIIRQADELGWPPSGGDQVGPATTSMVRWCLRHYAATWIGAIAFPRYRTHRPSASLVEAMGWLGRLCRRPVSRRYAEQRIPALLDQATPFYLLILQLDSDAQISRHSPFSDMGEVIDVALKSFAQRAPAGTMLVIKNHPLDNGLKNYGGLARKLAAQLGISDRMAFLDGGRLPPLLSRSRGVVVVNSTAGLQALHHGCPTMVLGDAIYAIPGLVSALPLDDFWNNPVEPDARLYRAFRAVVIARSQYNGSFYTEEGLALLLPTVSQYLSQAATANHAEEGHMRVREVVEILDELLPLLADLLNAINRLVLDEAVAARMPSGIPQWRDMPNPAMLHSRILRISNDLIRAIQLDTIDDTPTQSHLIEICGCVAMVRRLLSAFTLEPLPNGEILPKAAAPVSYLSTRHTIVSQTAKIVALEEIGMLHRLLLRLRLEAAKRVPTVVVSVDPTVDFSKIQSVDKPLLESAMRNSVPAQRRV